MRKPSFKLIGLLLALFFVIHGAGFAFSAANDEVYKLNDEIFNKKKQITEINAKINDYQAKINKEQKKTASLSGEIELIKNRIAKTELDIEAVGLEIDMLNLEIRALNRQTEAKQAEIDKQKQNLGSVVRSLYQVDQNSILKMMVLYNSFSLFFDQIKYLEDLQSSLISEMQKLKTQRTDLENKNKELVIKKNLLESKKNELEQKTDLLEEQKVARKILINTSLQSQKLLAASVAELKTEIARVDADITNIKASIMEKIKASDQYKIGENVILNWPVDSKKGLSAIFHDPEYPFRYIYEHPGIDIRTPQGTRVLAAAPGYVVKAYNGGYGYSYIILIHFDGSFTVYGHVSRINVKNDAYVDRGATIGLSGGMPGTPGAGKLTTGPHLHFEVRNKNNQPVNPLNYLLTIY